MAVRALSPGMNDPYTAGECVEQLGVGLAKLASRRLPEALRADESGQLRVVARPASLADALDAALDPVRDAAGAHGPVHLRLVEAMERVEGSLRRPADADALASHARALRARLGSFPGEEARGQFQRLASRVDALIGRLDRRPRHHSSIGPGGGLPG
jgi:uncharacterized membrane protein